MNAKKMYRVIAPIVAFACLCAVDYFANKDRVSESIDLHCRMAGEVWQVSHDLVGFQGSKVLPTKGTHSFDVYLVGHDYCFVSDPKHRVDAVNKGLTCHSSPASNSIAGESGVMLSTDYRGEHVISAYGPVRHEGVEYGLLVEVDVVEATDVVTSFWYKLDEILLGLLALFSVIITIRERHVTARDIVVEKLNEIGSSSSVVGQLITMKVWVNSTGAGMMLAHGDPCGTKPLGTIIKVNKAFALLLGYDWKTLEGNHVSMFHPDPIQHRQQIARFVDSSLMMMRANVRPLLRNGTRGESMRLAIEKITIEGKRYLAITVIDLSESASLNCRHAEDNLDFGTVNIENGVESNHGME